MLDGMTAPSYIGEVTKRLALLDRVQKKRHRANSYRRIYSFYRVANAVILSFTMIAVVWVILLEGNRHVNLIQAVTEKIGDFLRSECSDVMGVTIIPWFCRFCSLWEGGCFSIVCSQTMAVW